MRKLVLALALCALFASVTDAQTTKASGRQTLIVYAVQCGNCNPIPLSTAQKAGVDLNGILKADSYGKIWFTGTVDGTPPDAVQVKVAALSQTIGCNASQMAEQAKTAGLAQGIDPAKYMRRLFLLSGITANCQGSGSSVVGSIPSDSYDYTGMGDTRVTAHEMTHAIGQGIHDKAGSSPTGGGLEEYGDFFSRMGSTNGIASPFTREFFGWFSGTQLLTVTMAGQYTLLPLDAFDTSGTRALKLVTPNGSVVYVSYRAGTNYSAQKPIGVIVEIKQGPTINGIYLAKWVNETGGNAYMAKAGDGFNSVPHSVYIKLIALTPDSASVRVDFAVNPNPVEGWTYCGGDSSRCQLPTGDNYQAARGAVQTYTYRTVSGVFYCQADAFPPLPQPIIQPVGCYYKLDGASPPSSPNPPSIVAQTVSEPSAPQPPSVKAVESSNLQPPTLTAGAIQ